MSSIGITPYACNAYNKTLRINPDKIICAKELGIEVREVGNFDTFVMDGELPNRFEGFDTVHSVMERYVELYNEIHDFYKNDAEALEIAISHLDSDFMGRISYVFGFTEPVRELGPGFDPACYAAGQVSMGFIQAIRDGMNLEDAKKAAFDRATSELERIAEMYEEMLENPQEANAQHYFNPFANRTVLTIDNVMNLYRAATTVLTMVLSLAEMDKEN